jgi:hypothetical protein
MKVSEMSRAFITHGGEELNQGAQQLGFLPFLFYLKTEEDPASET